MAVRLRVLVVEDEPEMQRLLRDVLEREGFEVVVAGDGATALAAVTTERPDLVLLDLTLPGVDGLQVLEQIRTSTDLPVVVLSGRQSLLDRVGGLHLGADDYIVKPFHVAELLARIRAVMRRASPASQDAAEVGHLRLDAAARTCAFGEAPIDLTRKEFDLLLFLARHGDRAFSRARLLHEVWQSTSEWQDAGTVSEHVRRIRRKITLAGGPECIETVRGVGYRLSVAAVSPQAGVHPDD